MKRRVTLATKKRKVQEYDILLDECMKLQQANFALLRELIKMKKESQESKNVPDAQDNLLRNVDDMHVIVKNEN